MYFLKRNKTDELLPDECPYLVIRISEEEGEIHDEMIEVLRYSEGNEITATKEGDHCLLSDGTIDTSEVFRVMQ